MACEGLGRVELVDKWETVWRRWHVVLVHERQWGWGGYVVLQRGGRFAYVPIFFDLL